MTQTQYDQPRPAADVRTPDSAPPRPRATPPPRHPAPPTTLADETASWFVDPPEPGESPKAPPAPAPETTAPSRPRESADETASWFVDPPEPGESPKAPTTPPAPAPETTSPPPPRPTLTDLDPRQNPVEQVSPVATRVAQAPTTPRAETSADLQPTRIVRQQHKRTFKGWMVYAGTLGLREAAESPRALQLRLDTAAAQTPIPRTHNVVVVSKKGGVGKTTTTTVLGHQFASLRGDAVVAMDANPDSGTLSLRIGTTTNATVMQLLERERQEPIRDYPDVRAVLSQARSRLLSLAPDQDPTRSWGFTARDYATTLNVLQRFIPLVLTDCGTDTTHQVFSGSGGVLDHADQLVVVCGPGADEAHSASSTLDWLQAHGRQDLVEQAVVVVTQVPSGPPRKTGVDFDEVAAHFAGRVRAVARIPWDAHLASGGQITLEDTSPRTQRAVLALAARVGETFGQLPG